MWTRFPASEVLFFFLNVVVSYCASPDFEFSRRSFNPTEPPGSRLPVHLFSISRAPTLQHIADRMNLICVQNNLGPPARTVPALMNLACEVR